MSALVFVVLAAAGAILAFGTGRFRVAGTLVGFVAIVVALVAALAIEPGDRRELAGTALVGTAYGRLFLALGIGALLGVLLIGRLATWHRTAAAAVLGGAAALGLAVALPDPPTALMAASAAALVATLVVLAHPVTPSRVRALAREVRGVGVGFALAIAAVSIVTSQTPGIATGPAALGLALLAAVVALGHRLAAIPLHARASRLVDSAPIVALPLLLAWVPAGWAIILLGWASTAIAPASADLGLERTIVTGIAVATLVLGTIGALIQDEIEKVVAYTLVTDAGVVLLAFAALDDGGNVAVRGWLLGFIAAKAALAGCAIAIRAAYGTGRLRELGGWVRRSPLLAAAFAALAVAAIAWPGSVTWDSRLRLLQLSLGGPAVFLGFLGALGPAVAVARIVAIGVGRPTPIVVAGASDGPRGLAVPVAIGRAVASARARGDEIARNRRSARAEGAAGLAARRASAVRAAAHPVGAPAFGDTLGEAAVDVARGGTGISATGAGQSPPDIQGTLFGGPPDADDATLAQDAPADPPEPGEPGPAAADDGADGAVPEAAPEVGAWAVGEVLPAVSDVPPAVGDVPPAVGDIPPTVGEVEPPAEADPNPSEASGPGSPPPPRKGRSSEAAMDRPPSSFGPLREGPGAARASDSDDLEQEPPVADGTPAARGPGTRRTRGASGDMARAAGPRDNAPADPLPAGPPATGRLGRLLGGPARRSATRGRGADARPRIAGASGPAVAGVSRLNERPAGRRVRSPEDRPRRVDGARHLYDLNRAPLRSLIAVILAATALLAAAGAFGIRDAAAEPPPSPPAQGTPVLEQP